MNPVTAFNALRISRARPPGRAPILHLSPKQLAGRWGLSVRTVERWRIRGVGPLYLKIGHRVLYRLDDVEAFEAKRTRIQTTGRAVLMVGGRRDD